MSVPSGSYNFSQSIDDMIMLLACRYGANPHFDDEDEGENDEEDNNAIVSKQRGLESTSSRSVYIAAQQRRWGLVAEGLRHHLSHPLTAEERAFMKYVEVEMFTAEMCRNRAQYALWRRERHANEKHSSRAQKEGSVAAVDAGVAKATVTVSSFNIMRHSIQDEVARLYAQVRSSLPSCDDVVLSDDDDEDDEVDNENGKNEVQIEKNISLGPAKTTKNPFDKVKHFAMKSQADVDRDIALAKAEEELISQFAALQQEHFKKTRRWVDVPTNIMSAATDVATKASAIITAASLTTIASQRTATNFIGNGSTSSGADCNSQATLSAAESNLRSFEKAVGVIRSSADTAASVADKSRHFDPTRFTNSSSSSPLLCTNPQTKEAASSCTVKNSALDDPIQKAKQALNPYSALRPPRPSAQKHEYNDDDDDDDEDDEKEYAAFIAENGDDLKDMLKDWRGAGSTADKKSDDNSKNNNNNKAVTASKSADRSNTATVVVTSTAPPQVPVVAPPRGNRWNIVEYEDDESDASDDE